MSASVSQSRAAKRHPTDRRLPRRHQLQDAKLVYVENQSGAIIDCRLKDISDFGAGVVCGSTHDIPANVILKLGDGTLYDAEVMWRTDSRLGLRFNALQRRRAPRRRQLKSGELLVNESSAGIACRIRDISRHGAGLECDSNQHVPTNVILKISDGTLYEAEVAWQNQRHLGLRFREKQHLNQLVDDLTRLTRQMADNLAAAREIGARYQRHDYSENSHPRLETHLRKIGERAEACQAAIGEILAELGAD